MKKMISLALGATAVLALSGCNSSTGNGGYTSNLKIEYVDYTNSSVPQKSQVLIKNSADSAFDIVDIYSGPLHGTYKHSFPNDNPPNYIAPGTDRLFQTGDCQDYLEWWKIKIIDAYGNMAEGKYKRQCGYREILRITNW